MSSYPIVSVKELEKKIQEAVPERKEAIVVYHGRLYEDSCAYAIIKNTVGKVRVFKKNIYKKQSDFSYCYKCGCN